MLTQFEANVLMAIVKRLINPPPVLSIPPGADDRYELVAVTGREKFILDVQRGILRLSRLTLNERVRTCIVLVRLDIDGRPHTNPDGIEIGRSHLHVYREGFEEKWALPLSEVTTPEGKLIFSDASDNAKIFQSFCAYCHIENPPTVQEWIQ